MAELLGWESEDMGSVSEYTGDSGLAPSCTSVYVFVELEFFYCSPDTMLDSNLWAGVLGDSAVVKRTCKGPVLRELVL